MTDKDRHEIAGRAGVAKRSVVHQLFAVVTDVSDVLQVPDFNILQASWSSFETEEGCERLFRVGTSSDSGYRDGSSGVNPLTRDQILTLSGGGDVTDAVGGGTGFFRVRVEAATNRGNFFFVMDLNESIEFYASSVTMNLVGPSGTIEITGVNKSGGSGTVASLTGNVVVDTRIGAMIEPIEASTGLRVVQHTQLVPVAVNTAVTVPIPKFAESVRIIQSGGGGAAPTSGPWERRLGAATNSLNVGEINFSSRLSLPGDSDLGRETSLVTDTDAGAARLFQVQWTVRP